MPHLQLLTFAHHGRTEFDSPLFVAPGARAPTIRQLQTQIRSPDRKLKRLERHPAPTNRYRCPVAIRGSLLAEHAPSGSCREQTPEVVLVDAWLEPQDPRYPIIMET